MKKKIIIISIAVILCLLIFLFCSCCGFVQIGKVERAYAIFSYGDVELCGEMSDSDAQAIRKIFNGKFMISDSPACGFSEDISVCFNDSYTFCIARDTCPTVLLMEENKYFSLSKNEQEELYSILEKYGFSFPCV